MFVVFSMRIFVVLYIVISKRYFMSEMDRPYGSYFVKHNSLFLYKI